jgi:hypothetical protein
MSLNWAEDRAHAPKELLHHLEGLLGLGWCNCVAEVLGHCSEAVFCPLAIFDFCSGKDAFVVRLSGFEHVIDNSRQFESSGSNRFGSSEPSSHAAVKRS